MLNKKGFTIAEVVVSFSLISVILISLVSSMMFYRDKVKDEEVLTQLLDFKNTITKTIYDDIISSNITRAESCVGVGGSGGGADTCINLVDSQGNFHVLKLVEELDGDVNTKGIYLSYDGKKYWLPDSDLGTGNERVCDFVGSFELKAYNNKLYKIKATYRHKDLDKQYSILIIIN